MRSFISQHYRFDKIKLTDIWILVAVVFAGLISGFLILELPLKWFVIVAFGIIIIGGCFCSTEFGVTVLLALVILFQRTELHSLSIGFFGGGLKPIDIILVCILTGWLIRSFIKRRRLNFIRQQPSLSVILFVGWSTACALLGILNNTFYKDSLFELRPILQFLLILPLIAELDERKIERIVWTIFLATLIVSIRGVILYYQGIGAPAMHTQGGIRVSNLGFSYFIFSFLLSFCLFINNSKYKPALLLFMATCIASLTITFFRSAWIGLFGSLLIIFYFNRHHFKKRLFKLFLFLTLLATLTYFTAPAILGKSKNPVKDLGERLTSILHYEKDVSALHRLEEWKTAAEGIRQSPIIGKGLGYRLKFYSPMYSEEEKKMGFFHDDFYVHNSYIWIALKMGLVGIGLFLLMLVTVIKTGIQKLSSIPAGTNRGLLNGFFGSLTALIAISLFGPMFNIDHLTPFVAVCFASIYIIGTKNYSERKQL